jgi:hypothetical protein
VVAGVVGVVAGGVVTPPPPLQLKTEGPGIV